MANSKIDWTDKVWNPVTGCTKVSPGCANCYAERQSKRHAGRFGYPADEPFRVTLHPDRMDMPMKWKKPWRVFVNSMSDLFHPDVPFEFIAKVYDIIKQCPNHTFQILTKRVDRALEFYKWNVEQTGHYPGSYEWLRNVWFIATTENQDAANDRIPILLQIPAYTRGISTEPLLSDIKLSGLIPPPGTRFKCSFCGGYTKCCSLHCQTCGKEGGYSGSFANLNLVICGGESGPGARPMHPDWARSLRDQCQTAGVPYFFKQHGEWEPFYDRDNDDPDWNNIPQEKPGICRLNLAGGRGFHGDRVVYFRRVGKKAAGRLLDGREWDEMPCKNTV